MQIDLVLKKVIAEINTRKLDLTEMLKIVALSLSEERESSHVRGSSSSRSERGERSERSERSQRDGWSERISRGSKRDEPATPQHHPRGSLQFLYFFAFMNFSIACF